MKNILRSSAFSLLLALTGAFVFSGCVASGPVSDDDITASVKSDFSHDSRLTDITRIRVSTLNGVVYLKGYVPSADQISMAEKDADAVGGVKSVVNQLIVPPNNS